MKSMLPRDETHSPASWVNPHRLKGPAWVHFGSQVPGRVGFQGSGYAGEEKIDVAKLELAT